MTIGADGTAMIRELEAQVAMLTAEVHKWSTDFNDLAGIACNEVKKKIAFESEIARLHQALDDFGRHRFDCDAVPNGDKACICGFDAARQRTQDAATDGKAE